MKWSGRRVLTPDYWVDKPRVLALNYARIMFISSFEVDSSF